MRIHACFREIILLHCMTSAGSHVSVKKTRTRPASLRTLETCWLLNFSKVGQMFTLVPACHKGGDLYEEQQHLKEGVLWRSLWFLWKVAPFARSKHSPWRGLNSLRLSYFRWKWCVCSRYKHREVVHHIPKWRIVPYDYLAQHSSVKPLRNQIEAETP